MILTLSFELDGQVVHAPFYAVLDSFGSWLHAAPSTWLISSSADPEDLAYVLRSQFPEQKQFLIAEFASIHTEPLPDSVWKWIATQRRRELQRNIVPALDPVCSACITLGCESCAHRNSLTDTQDREHRKSSPFAWLDTLLCTGVPSASL
jgi:hypothetical protein